MKTSAQLLEEQNQEPKLIPLHGKFTFFDSYGNISHERVTENYLPAAEFRDLALQARRKAAVIIAAADSMDAWMVAHVQI